MKGNIKRPPGCHGLLELPLFAWADRRLAPLTTGAAWLHRHYRLPRELAEVVAELAGIGPEHRR
jgi:hypothetical protein